MSPLEMGIHFNDGERRHKTTSKMSQKRTSTSNKKPKVKTTHSNLRQDQVSSPQPKLILQLLVFISCFLLVTNTITKCDALLPQWPSFSSWNARTAPSDQSNSSDSVINNNNKNQWPTDQSVKPPPTSLDYGVVAREQGNHNDIGPNQQQPIRRLEGKEVVGFPSARDERGGNIVVLMMNDDPLAKGIMMGPASPAAPAENEKKRQWQQGELEHENEIEGVTRLSMLFGFQERKGKGENFDDIDPRTWDREAQLQSQPEPPTSIPIATSSSPNPIPIEQQLGSKKRAIDMANNKIGPIGLRASGIIEAKLEAEESEGKTTTTSTRRKRDSDNVNENEYKSNERGSVHSEKSNESVQSHGHHHQQDQRTTNSNLSSGSASIGRRTRTQMMIISNELIPKQNAGLSGAGDHRGTRTTTRVVGNASYGNQSLAACWNRSCQKRIRLMTQRPETTTGDSSFSLNSSSRQLKTAAGWRTGSGPQVGAQHLDYGRISLLGARSLEANDGITSNAITNRFYQQRTTRSLDSGELILPSDHGENKDEMDKQIISRTSRNRRSLVAVRSSKTGGQSGTHPISFMNQNSSSQVEIRDRRIHDNNDDDSDKLQASPNSAPIQPLSGHVYDNAEMNQPMKSSELDGKIWSSSSPQDSSSTIKSPKTKANNDNNNDNPCDNNEKNDGCQRKLKETSQTSSKSKLSFHYEQDDDLLLWPESREWLRELEPREKWASTGSGSSKHRVKYSLPYAGSRVQLDLDGNEIDVEPDHQVPSSSLTSKHLPPIGGDKRQLKTIYFAGFFPHLGEFSMLTTNKYNQDKIATKSNKLIDDNKPNNRRKLRTRLSKEQRSESAEPDAGVLLNEEAATHHSTFDDNDDSSVDLPARNGKESDDQIMINYANLPVTSTSSTTSPMEAPTNDNTNADLNSLLATDQTSTDLMGGLNPNSKKQANNNNIRPISGPSPLNNYNQLGKLVLPAVRLALEHINRNRTLLRNYRLEIVPSDTQCNATISLRKFFDLVYQEPKKMLLYGDACRVSTDPIAKASYFFDLIQISYADTDPIYTTDNYPNFFRVIPSENALSSARIPFIRHFNWTRVGTIYQNLPRYSLPHSKLLTDLERYNIVIKETVSLPGSIDGLQNRDLGDELRKLKERDVRIILGNFDEQWALLLFCEAFRERMTGRKYQWILTGISEDRLWRYYKQHGSACTESELLIAMDGYIITDITPVTRSQETTISGLRAQEFSDEYRRQASALLGPLAEDMRLEENKFYGYVYDGIWAIALALDLVDRHLTSAQGLQQRGKLWLAPRLKALKSLIDFEYSEPIWANMIRAALNRTKFSGVTGTVSFDKNERPGLITFSQFQAHQESRSEVVIASYDALEDKLDFEVGFPIFWRGSSPPIDYTIQLVTPFRINRTVFIVISILAIFGIILAIIFLTINIKFRNQRYIKMSSPYLNNLIIIGCILTYTSVIILGVDSGLTSESNFPYICNARAWVLMAGFTLAFGSMFSKTFRVHSIFTNIKLHKKVIKDYKLFMVVFILLTFDICILVVWQYFDPFYRETNNGTSIQNLEKEDIIIVPEMEHCQSHRMSIFLSIIYVYKGLLMAFGCFLAWETRHVSIPALNDSKYIGLSVYNVVIMCVIGAGLSFALRDQQDVSFVIISIFIIFCSTTTLCLVFVPKVRMLIELRQNPKAADQRVRATLKTFAKNYRDGGGTSGSNMAINCRNQHGTFIHGGSRNLVDLNDKIKLLQEDNGKQKNVLRDKTYELEALTYKYKKMVSMIQSGQYLQVLNTTTAANQLQKQQQQLHQQQQQQQQQVITNNPLRLQNASNQSSISQALGGANQQLILPVSGDTAAGLMKCPSQSSTGQVSFGGFFSRPDQLGVMGRLPFGASGSFRSPVGLQARKPLVGGAQLNTKPISPCFSQSPSLTLNNNMNESNNNNNCHLNTELTVDASTTCSTTRFTSYATTTSTSYNNNNTNNTNTQATNDYSSMGMVLNEISTANNNENSSNKEISLGSLVKLKLGRGVVSQVGACTGDNNDIMTLAPDASTSSCKSFNSKDQFDMENSENLLAAEFKDCNKHNNKLVIDEEELLRSANQIPRASSMIEFLGSLYLPELNNIQQNLPIKSNSKNGSPKDKRRLIDKASLHGCSQNYDHNDKRRTQIEYLDIDYDENDDVDGEDKGENQCCCHCDTCYGLLLRTDNTTTTTTTTTTTNTSTTSTTDSGRDDGRSTDGHQQLGARFDSASSLNSNCDLESSLQEINNPYQDSLASQVSCSLCCSAAYCSIRADDGGAEDTECYHQSDAESALQGAQSEYDEFEEEEQGDDGGDDDDDVEDSEDRQHGEQSCEVSSEMGCKTQATRHKRLRSNKRPSPGHHGTKGPSQAVSSNNQVVASGSKTTATESRNWICTGPSCKTNYSVQLPSDQHGHQHNHHHHHASMHHYTLSQSSHTSGSSSSSTNSVGPAGSTIDHRASSGRPTQGEGVSKPIDVRTIARATTTTGIVPETGPAHGTQPLLDRNSSSLHQAKTEGKFPIVANQHIEKHLQKKLHQQVRRSHLLLDEKEVISHPDDNNPSVILLSANKTTNKKEDRISESQVNRGIDHSIKINEVNRDGEFHSTDNADSINIRCDILESL